MATFRSDPYTSDRRDAVYRLFEEEDFYYRTSVPATLSAADIEELIQGTGTQVLSADGTTVGLWSVDNLLWQAHELDRFTGQGLLSFRLGSTAPLTWWVRAYGNIVEGLRFRDELVRLSLEVYEFDRAGNAVATALGLADEGIIPDLVEWRRRRWGKRVYGEVWLPEGVTTDPSETPGESRGV